MSNSAESKKLSYTNAELLEMAHLALCIDQPKSKQTALNPTAFKEAGAVGSVKAVKAEDYSFFKKRLKLNTHNAKEVVIY